MLPDITQSQGFQNLQNSPSGDQGSAPSAQSEQSQETKSAPTSADLETFNEFTFQGEKYTPESFSKMMNDYKKLTQTQSDYAKYDKFYKNLDVDLRSVRENPSLAAKFKSTYPERFHAYLDVLGLEESAEESSSQNVNHQGMNLPKEVLEKLQRIDLIDQKLHQAEVEANQAQIDSVLDPLLKKYPLASENDVLIKAENLLQQGYKLTKTTWERLVKDSNETWTKKADDYHKARLKEQIETGKRGFDTGAGGSAPGQAPRRAKSIAEATEMAIQHFNRKS